MLARFLWKGGLIIILQKILTMKKLSALAFCTCITTIAFAQYNSKNLTIKEETAVQFTYKNLRLYPIYANQTFLEAHKDIGKYTPLQKALEQKKITVTETVGSSSNSTLQNARGGGETVNTLYIENVSNDTIMLMAGEVVKGGKQDRVLAQDMILPPMSGKKDISVFCVEQGRWNYSDESQKEKNAFYGYSKVSSMNVRKVAVVDKSQQKVWQNVADVTAKNSAATESGTYTALDTSKKYNADLKGYNDYFKAIMKNQNNVIGVVACTGDKVIGSDMFATPDMFKLYFDNLMNSYSTEAITSGSSAKTDYKTVQTYLDKFLADESKQEEELKKNGTYLKHRGKKLHCASF